MKQICWVVQENLSSDRRTYSDMVDAFKKHGIDYKLVQVIPFDDKLPEFDHSKLNIFYGSTTMMNMIYNTPNLRPGLFFNHETFRMNVYNREWTDRMLNFEAYCSTFKDVHKLPFKSEDLLFIRPIEDSKLFDGQLMTFENIKNWQTSIQVIKDSVIKDDIEIIVGEPYKINKEWRNFIVNGKVVGSSRYTKNGRLNKSADDIPADMIKYCEDACKIYTPHDIFVMDIAETGGDYFIVECGCINSTGFYLANVESIVVNIHNYVKNQIEISL